MLHVRDSGRGPAVLFLHAFPLNSRMWEPQLEILADRARAIAVDLPGFGLSAPSEGSPSLADFARDVVALLDHLRIDRVMVVGLSMGGYVAFRLVEEIGPRVSALLLADTRATADDASAVAGRHELAAEVESQGVQVAVNEFLPKLIGRTTLRSRPALVDRVRAIMMENSVPGVAAALRALAGRPDSTALLSRLQCPVTCVVGDEDTITPPETARAMAARIPRARVVVLPESGHLSNLEAAEGFNEVIEEMLSVSGSRLEDG